MARLDQALLYRRRIGSITSKAVNVNSYGPIEAVKLAAAEKMIASKATFAGDKTRRRRQIETRVERRYSAGRGHD